MEKLHLQEEVWDKKKILLALLSAAVIIGGGVYGIQAFVLDDKSQSYQQDVRDSTKGNVEGAKTEKEEENKETKPVISQKAPFSLPAVNVEKQLESIKQQVQKIDVSEIASSSSQIQKLLKDIASLEQYPRNQAKEICENLCKSL